VAQLGATSSVPRHRVDSNSQVIDNFSWKINKHALKFGVDFHRTSVQQYFDKYFRGRLKFASVSDFLTGNVGSGFQYFGDSTVTPSRTTLVFTFRMASGLRRD